MAIKKPPGKSFRLLSVIELSLSFLPVQEHSQHFLWLSVVTLGLINYTSGVEIRGVTTAVVKTVTIYDMELHQPAHTVEQRNSRNCHSITTSIFWM